MPSNLLPPPSPGEAPSSAPSAEVRPPAEVRPAADAPSRRASERAAAASEPWATRWAHLRRAAGLAPDEPLAIALSGGADSVLLLELVAATRPRPDVVALHVQHGLRGAESEGDADFCAALCARLGVPFTRLDVALDADAPNLEERAREARYTALLAELRRIGRSVLLTGHHADDGIETLVMRWLRGGHLGALAPPRAELLVRGPHPGAPPEDGLDAAPVRLVRPLRGFRREEVRQLLRARGLAWREDGSNSQDGFTRNRIRNRLLPAVDALLGPGAREGLLRFADAVTRLEDGLAAATAEIAWRPAHHALATRGPAAAALGGWLPRAELAGLPQPLARRALWRLIVEGTGRTPQRAALDALARDVSMGRTGRRSLPGAWVLVLRSSELLLLPPRRALSGPQRTLPAREAPALEQALLPFPGRGPRALADDAVHAFAVPGEIRLADGRCIAAAWVDGAEIRPFPRGPGAVELDAHGLCGELAVRFPRPGDRFHPLGAPGSRPLARFLADAGVPREERALVPLVVAGDELLWAVGLRPSDARRVAPTTGRRLRLSLVGAGALFAG